MSRSEKDSQVEEVGGENAPATAQRSGQVSGKNLALGGAIGTLLLAAGWLAQMGFIPSPQEKMDTEKRLLRIEQRQEEAADASARQQSEILKAVQEINSKLDSKMSVQSFEVWRLKLQLSNPQVALNVPAP